MLKDVNERIDELLKKPASPETLNALGDLYLRKSNRVRAVEYYYRSADMLHSGQKDRKIALFKKILKVAPAEERAYEELAALFAKIGLHAEEKKYLHKLIQICQTKGEYNRVNSLFRRIQQVDPSDPLAATYFHHGKRVPFGQQTLQADTAQFFAPEPAEEQEEAPERGESRKQEPAEEKPQPVKGREEPAAAPAPDGQAPKPGAAFPTRQTLVIAGIACLALVIALVAVGALRRKGADHGSAAKEEQRRIVETLAEGYRITVSEISRNSIAAGTVAEQDLRKNRFFRITVVMPSGCIPDAFAEAPGEHISWINAQNAASPVVPVKGLEAMTRVIRKLNACGRDSAPVSVSFVAAFPPAADVRGLQAAGLSQQGALLIQCEVK
ncbi:MAG: hypothetical protein OHK006_00310 [Thermodesulfovibrionales bacterium]